MRKWKLSLLVLTILFTMSWCLVFGQKVNLKELQKFIRIRPEGKPNIVIILAGDLGFGDLGCFGQAKVKTPHIDAVAAEGLKFYNFYSGASLDNPSRAVLLTGKSTFNSKVKDNKSSLPSSEITLARVLRAAGYKCGFFGLWGLGSNPGNTPIWHSFDEWYGYLDLGSLTNYYPETMSRNDKQIVVYQNQGNRKGVYAPDHFTFAALNFIRINTDFPFLMIVSYPVPYAVGTNSQYIVPYDKPYSNEPWTQSAKNRAAMIDIFDRYVGAIIDAIKKYKLDRETIVFITSVTGAPTDEASTNLLSNAGFRGGKGNLYEGGIHVPMIVWAPGFVEPGTCNEIWSMQDILPTAEALAGLPVTDSFDGVSMLPVFKKEKHSTNRFLVWEQTVAGSLQRAFLMDNWKAIKDDKNGFELYNLAVDPFEKTNVVNQNPEVLNSILDKAKSLKKTN